MLDRALGWPFDTSLAMARLVYGGVFERHPDIKFVTHHMGGMIPYFATRIEAFERDRRGVCATRYRGEQRPALTGPALDHFRRFYNDCISNGSAEALTMAIGFFGADHILFGTDFPFGPPDGPLGATRRACAPSPRDAQRRRTRADPPRRTREWAPRICSDFGAGLRPHL